MDSLGLDALAVRKVGHPPQPGYGIGAVTPRGGLNMRSPDGLTEEEVAAAVAGPRRRSSIGGSTAAGVALEELEAHAREVALAWTPWLAGKSFHDALLDAETVGPRAAMSLWTRDELKRFPFLRVD